MLFKDRTGRALAVTVLLRGCICAGVFILCVSGLTFAPNVITELNFNEGSGTTASDLSGNAHNGTLVNGPVWVAGKYGQAVSFDGNNDYVNLGDHADYTLNPAQSYTWSGWVRNNNFNAWSTIWSQSLNTSGYFYFYAHSTTDQEAGPVTNGLSVFWYNGSSRLVLHSNNNVLSTGTWSYVAITYNASQSQSNRFTIYVNGTDVTDRSDVVSTGTIATIDPTDIRIGSNQPFGEYFNGAVDEMRYYRRLLSVAEIQSDMNINSTADVTAPTVSITAPAAGTVSGTINVTATANDNTGVAGVQFLLDGVNLGAEDITSPYSFSWNTTTATNGSHTLTAKARDAAGNITTSSGIVVTVSNADTQAPSVTMTSPAAGAQTGSITVSANATDNVGVVGVQFYFNGISLNQEDTSPPFSIIFNTTTVADATYSLTARARDAAGNMTTSSPVVINVTNPDVTAPTVSITEPAAGSVAGTVNITAAASDNKAVAGVQFLLDGANLGAEDVTAPYSATWNTTAVATGTYTLTARARDAAGNTSTSSGVVVTVNNNDTQAPTVTMTSPAAGAQTGSITVSANATDNVGVVGVQFYFNGISLNQEDTSPPFSIIFNTTTVADATYSLTARARDAAGNMTTSSPVVINVTNPDVTAPTVSITAPAAGNVTGTVNITAAASDNKAVAGVQFLLDGANLGAEDITSPYTFSWNTATVTSGPHVLTARARDAAGNTTTSAAVNVTVANDTEAPSVIVLPPSGQNVFGTVTLEANASDNTGVVGVQFLLDGVNLGAEDLTAPYSVSWNTTTTTNGSHTLTARARDPAGNTATSPSTIVLVSNATGATNRLAAIHFDEGTGTNAADISGNNHNGTLSSGASWTAGKYGQSVNLNGSSNYVNIADHADFTLNPTQNYTWSAWVKNNNFNESGTVWSQTINASNFFYIYAHSTSDPDGGPVTNGVSVHWWVNSGSSKLSVHSNNNVLTAGQWSHITVTYNGSAAQNNRFTIYVNGVDVTARTDISSAGSISSIDATDIRIGSNQPFGEYLSGAVDEVRYYNRLLTASEITTDMNTPLGTDTNAPTVSISAPANNATVAGTISVTANASDNVGVAGVEFLLDGSSLGAEDLTAPYSLSWNTTTATSGNHILTARARDAAGNIATSTGVTVNVSNDSQAPSVTVNAPVSSPVSGNINVTATASDNIGVVGVQFYVDGVALGAEDIAAPYSVLWNTATASNGSHNITAKARDAAGNVKISAAVIFTVNNIQDTQSPVVAISSPTAGNNVSGTINVNANASDNIGVVGVQFLIDGVVLGAEDMAAPYTVSWNTTTVTNGSHSLTARARDAAGNTTRSSPVVVTVSNAADVKAPTVSLTAPAVGSTVGGIVTVSATATDNIGVAGVQFLLDGVALGTEDTNTPYSISWNSGFTTTGSHTLSARARDAAGNTGIAPNVSITVIMTDPPVISGITVTNISSGSATVSWTTNVPTNAQVIYGTTTAYGLSTLVDQTLATTHSMLLSGLAPGTLYHYQVLSADVNTTLATSADGTFSSTNLSSSLGTLNGHNVLAEGGKILSWTPNPLDGYHTVITLAWNYMLNTVPNDPSTGKPAYYSRSYIDPNTQAMVSWPHNPAGLYAQMQESAQKYYQYSGNTAVMQVAENVALWQLDHGMTLAADSWPLVPYASGDAGSLNYGGAAYGNGNGQGDGVGYIQPDKVGELGYAWLQLYKYDGNTRFKDAAIQAANVLSSKIRVGTVSQSPWPYRVNAHTGVVREDYCSHIIAPISLLDGLIAAGLGDTAAYRTARNIAWTWMMTYPMVNNVWAQYFEDVPIQPSYNSNLNQYNAMMTARYLLEHPEFDPNWEAHVRGLISWVETKFGQTNLTALTIKEQDPIFPYAMGSHTARYASVNALLYEKTGDLAAKEKAFRSFNWATYMTKTNGVVIDGPNVDHEWFTDGYGDYIRHFVTGMASVPEWSPSNQTHMLRSNSIVKSITYGTNSVNYTTSEGTSTEVLHLNFTPGTVTADGVVLQKRSDLSQPGWTIDVATKTIRVYHVNATQIIISAGNPNQVVFRR